MAKRLAGANPHDFMAVARRVVEEAIGEKLDGSPLPKKTRRGAGGAKGGRVRAQTLTAEQRSEIARTAAQARWKKG
jgi:hypothetical protein